jgi:hypothetical protein
LRVRFVKRVDGLRIRNEEWASRNRRITKLATELSQLTLAARRGEVHGCVIGRTLRQARVVEADQVEVVRLANLDSPCADRLPIQIFSPTAMGF